MKIVEYLAQRKVVVEKEIAALCDEINAIDAALSAIETKQDKPLDLNSFTRMYPRMEHIMPIDDAIVEAVRSGTRTPAKILAFLSSELGIETTINSGRTRVSRMKNNGRLAHDGQGWILPESDDEPAGEGAPLDESSDDDRPEERVA